MPSSTSTRSPTPDTNVGNIPTSATPQPNRYPCPDCDRSYKAVETLNRHRKNHSSSIRYSCSSCTASFKRKDLLDRHVQIHEGGRGAVLTSTRGVRACERCSRLKTKCDRVDGGSCSRCVKGGHVCSCRERRGRGRWGKEDGGVVRSLKACGTHPEAGIGGECMMNAEDQGRGLARAFSDPGDFARSYPGSWSSEGAFWDQGHSWQWPEVLDSQLEAVQDVLPELSIYGESPAGFDATWPETFDPALAIDLPPPEKSNPGLDYNAGCCNDMSWCDCPPALILPEAALWAPDCLSGDMAALTMLYPQAMYPIRSSI